MLKKQWAVALIATATMLLAACQKEKSSEPGKQSTVPPITSSKSESHGEYDNYKKLEDFEKGVNTYLDGSGNEKLLNRHLMEANAGTPCLESVGEQRILVVPLGLEDDEGTSPAYPAVSRSGRTEKQTQKRLEQIENLFFGEAEDTGWQSLKSFYETASFGKLTITGAVMKQDGGWFRPGKKPSEYDSSKALNDIKKFYTTEYAKADHGALGADAHEWTWFDQDRDGYIDTIWIVYSAAIHAYETSTTSMSYWAYVSRTGNSKNVSSPNPMCYAWASIDFMDQAYGEGLDAHTFIHETGHIFEEA